eukprot:779002-Amphidinium_carterae.1
MALPAVAFASAPALQEAWELSSCDGLYCISIGYTEYDGRFAKEPHPRHFHTFMVYYDAELQAVRLENAWEGRYTFTSWREIEANMTAEYRQARSRYGGGRWLPAAQWQRTFLGQLVAVLDTHIKRKPCRQII